MLSNGQLNVFRPIFSKGMSENAKTKKIVWVCTLILDRFLNKAERMERLRHLSMKGYDVYLIAQYSNEKYDSINSNLHLIQIPLRFKPLIFSVLYGFILFFFLPFYLIMIRPNFVISDPEPTPFLIWKPILSKLLKFEMILDIRSTPVETYGLRGHLQHIYFNTSVCIAKKMFDGMTIVTSHMKKEICQKFNINPNFVSVLSNGVSDELLTYDKHRRYRKKLREKFGLSNRFVVLYHGSLRIKGGLFESIRSLALLKKEYSNVTLFLLGSGSAFHLLESAIKENGVQDRVMLHKGVDYHDVPRYISMCDVGIVPLPNISEWRYQQPVKLLEYLAMRKVVIVSDIPAHRSIIGSNKNGIYVTSVNPAEIARAIRYAYDNRDKLDEWGEIGRELVIKEYTWKKVTEDLLNILEKHSSMQASQKRGKSIH